MNYPNVPLAEAVRRFTQANVDKNVILQNDAALTRRSGTDAEDLILAYCTAATNSLATRSEQTYGELRLIREPVTLDEVHTRLVRAVDSGSFTLVDGVNVEIERLATLDLRPSDEPEAGVGPRFLIELPTKHRGELSSAGPIVRYGQTSFTSVEQAVRAWIPLRPFHGTSDNRLGRSLIEVPLAGPRLGAVDLLDERTLRIALEQANPDTPVELTGVWQSADASFVLPFASRFTGGPIDVTKPAWADRVALWLVSADSQVRDYFIEDTYRCSRRRRILYPETNHTGKMEISVRAQIQAGEGEQVEFKPFLTLNTPKTEELIRTVIAFANKSGGTIYLGVNDYQEINGVEKELRDSAPAEKKASLPACAAWYCAALRKRIVDRMNAAIVFECDSLEIGGKLLIRVKVLESKSKPCCDVNTKEIWTRRGANTVRPDPSGDELKKLINGSNPMAEFFARP